MELNEFLETLGEHKIITTGDNMEATTKIQKMSQKTGNKADGTPWTKYNIQGENGHWYSTFNYHPHAEGDTVTINYIVKPYGNEGKTANNILTIQKVLPENDDTPRETGMNTPTSESKEPVNAPLSENKTVVSKDTSIKRQAVVKGIGSVMEGAALGGIQFKDMDEYRREVKKTAIDLEENFIDRVDEEIPF